MVATARTFSGAGSHTQQHDRGGGHGCGQSILPEGSPFCQLICVCPYFTYQPSKAPWTGLLISCQAVKQYMTHPGSDFNVSGGSQHSDKATPDMTQPAAGVRHMN